jgi:hypothetical protein
MNIKIKRSKHIHIQIYIHTHTYAYIHTYIHTYIHIYKYIPPRQLCFVKSNIAKYPHITATQSLNILNRKIEWILLDITNKLMINIEFFEFPSRYSVVINMKLRTYSAAKIHWPIYIYMCIYLCIYMYIRIYIYIYICIWS